MHKRLWDIGVLFSIWMRTNSTVKKWTTSLQSQAFHGLDFMHNVLIYVVYISKLATAIINSQTN